jgi:hypothetical protein
MTNGAPATAPQIRGPVSFGWEELDDEQGSPISTVYERAANRVTRRFRVNNEWLYARTDGTINPLRHAANDVLGYATYDPNDPGDGAIKRWLPVTDPDDAAMIAMRLEVEGVNAYGDKSDKLWPTDLTVELGPEFEWYLFTVQFEHPPFNVFYDHEVSGHPLREAARFCVNQVRFSVKQQDVLQGIAALKPTAGSAYAPEDKPPRIIGRGLGVLEPITEIRLTLLDWPVKAVRTDLEDYMGAVNSTELSLPYLDDYRVYPKEQVLFLTPEISPLKAFPDGTQCVDLSLTFQYRQKATWQKTLLPDGSYHEVCAADDVNWRPYQVKDLSELLKGSPV